MRILKTCVVSTVILMGISSCGKKKDDDAAKTGKVNIKFAKGKTSLALTNTTASTFADLPIAASATADGLYSFKMFFREIKICTALSFTSGTGYTVTGPCASIYTNDSVAYTGTEAPTAAHRALMAAAGDGAFYDVLSATDREKLTKTVDIPVGDYSYGIIETHPWVKMSAKNGTLCTKAAGASEIEATGGDGFKTYRTRVDSLTCGTSTQGEEVLNFITNANTTFKFQKPFSVVEGQEVSVDLAFNLDSEIKSEVGGGSTPNSLYSKDNDSYFYVPMIKMSPAPRKATETTKVEEYVLGTAASKEKIRVLLYYSSGDTEKTILGVNATVLTTAASTTTKANKPIYAQNATQTSGEVILSGYDGTEILRFTRGAAGTATLKCATTTGTGGLEGCTGQTSVSLTFAAPTTLDL